MSLLSKIRENRDSMFKKTQESFSSGTQVENPFYYPKLSEAKNASVIIRFLPSIDPNALPYVLTYKHGFKGDDSKWVFQDLCPTTYGDPCPICDCNRKLWDTGDEQFRNIARGRSRKKMYIANVYIISDPTQPEKEGKVFPFAFGPEIFNIIKTSIKPEFEDEEPVFPFDLFDGADFNLKIVMQKDKKMITYSKSAFINKNSAFLDGNEELIEKILETCEPLSKWTDPSRSKPYDKILRLCRGAYLHVLDIAGDTLKSESPRKEKEIEETKLPTDEDLDRDSEEETPVVKKKKAPVKSKKVEPVEEDEDSDEDEDDDDINYFKNIANS